MSEIAVIATELGLMAPDTFRNAIKQAVKAITKSLPETMETIDVSNVRLVSTDSDFFIDAKSNFIKETLSAVKLNIETKEALKPIKDQGKSTILEPVEKGSPAGTKNKAMYEDEVMGALETFITSKPLDQNGLMDLTEVRVTYYVDGSFSIESGIPVVVNPTIPAQEEVIIEGPPVDAIFAGGPDIPGSEVS